jgi:hypothetical protein
MIEVTVSVAAMASLFVLFGLLGLSFKQGCGGDCGSCAHECELETEGDLL